MSNYIDLMDTNLQGEGLVIGVVMSRFNLPISEALRAACMEELTKLGLIAENIVCLTVPGALEIPLVLQGLAESGEYDALIALGAVIRGETYHFELVANEAARGISTVGLEYGIPIANAILTTENEEQALNRVEKGREAARVAVEMANLFSMKEFKL